MSAPRGLGGKTVKNRCGTAAVTGDDPLMTPLRGKCRSGRQGRERTGSQKTCRQERVVFPKPAVEFRNLGRIRAGRPPRCQGHARENASGSKTAFRDSLNGSRFFSQFPKPIPPLSNTTSRADSLNFSCYSAWCLTFLFEAVRNMSLLTGYLIGRVFVSYLYSYSFFWRSSPPSAAANRRVLLRRPLQSIRKKRCSLRTSPPKAKMSPVLTVA